MNPNIKKDLDKIKKKAQLRRALTKGELFVKMKSRNFSLDMTDYKISS